MSRLSGLSVRDQIELKPKGHYTITPHGGRFRITINRPGEAVERVFPPMPGAANRIATQLADMGLTGLWEDAR